MKKIETQYDTTLGSLRETAREHYLATGKKMPFLRVMHLAPRMELHQHVFSPNLMRLEEFQEVIDQTPLSKNFIQVAEKNNDYRRDVFSYGSIPENSIFAHEKDNIVIHMHIPYIDDGMHVHDHFEIDYVYHCFLQALFGENCKIKMENFASPKWRKLQNCFHGSLSVTWGSAASVALPHTSTTGNSA